jgi:hypothetical protein
VIRCACPFLFLLLFMLYFCCGKISGGLYGQN